MHSRGSALKLIILAFVAIALPFITNEWFGEWFHTTRYLNFLHPEYWFKSYAPGRPTQVQINDIRIVTITRDIDPDTALGENRCTHRKFMATLLKKLITVHPTLVAIDKWYNRIPPGACDPNNDTTKDLRDALWNLAKTAKVVIAVESYNQEEAKQFCQPPLARPLGPEEVVLADYQDFLGFSPMDDKQAIKDKTIAEPHPGWGLARLNVDIRKIPLGWMAFEQCKDVGAKKPAMVGTLATAGAELLDENILEGRDFGKLREQVTHPYTKLVLEDPKHGGFRPVSAISLICNQTKPADWQKCQPNEGDSANLQSLEGKKIVIGETRKDYFQADGEEIPGSTLQATYIASLLSQNALAPVNIWINRIIGVAWLALIFWFFYFRFTSSPELAAVVSAVSTFAFGFFFSAVVTRQFGFFADVVPPTVIEIIGLYVARKTERLLEHKETRRAARKVSL